MGKNFIDYLIIHIISACKTIVKALTKVCKVVVGIFTSLSTTFGKVAVISMTLALIICSYGVATVIINGDLTFVVNPATGGGGDGESKKAGSNLSDYEKAVLMAEALDLDLMNEDYNNTDSMKEFFKANNPLQRFADGTAKSTHTPAKLVEIFLLIDDIYNHPSVNGDEYMSDCLPNLLYGSWVSEHGMVSGDADRLYDISNSLPSRYNVNGPYYVPLGQRYDQWTVTTRDSGYHMGCTYISKYENPDIPDEQRGIMGGANAIFDTGTAMYLTGGTSFLRRENTNFVKSSDPAYTHLASYTLASGWPVTRRGFQTWLPDPFYNFAIINRIFFEGYDRDTQYKSGMYGPDNMLAIKEVCELSGFTKEETSVFHSIIYANDRFMREKVEVLPNNVNAEGKPEWWGCLAAFELILVGEGYHEKLTQAIIDDPNIILTGNYDIGDPVFGDCKSSMPYSFVYDSENSYLGEIMKKIETGDLTKTYPDYILNRVHYLVDYHNNLGSILAVPGNQGTVRLLYGFGNYAKGGYAMYCLQETIKAYYNYQDENGDYKYRLYDVDFGEESESGLGDSTEANGSGPFGLPYYNDDGSINEEALLAANNLFIQITNYSYLRNKTITVPNSITVDINGTSKTFQLKGGEYPNFWGLTYNNNASEGWGQCTWWARGRAELWIYENVSTDISKWGIYCGGNGSSRGNGNVMAGNLANDHKWLLDSTPKVGSVGSAISAVHVYYIEAVATNGNYYISHGNMAASNSCTKRVSPTSSFMDNWGITNYRCSTTYKEYINAGTGGGYSYIEAIPSGKTWSSKGMKVCHLFVNG